MAVRSWVAVRGCVAGAVQPAVDVGDLRDALTDTVDSRARGSRLTAGDCRRHRRAMSARGERQRRPRRARACRSVAAQHGEARGSGARAGARAGRGAQLMRGERDSAPAQRQEGHPRGGQSPGGRKSGDLEDHDPFTPWLGECLLQTTTPHVAGVTTGRRQEMPARPVSTCDGSVAFRAARPGIMGRYGRGTVRPGFGCRFRPSLP
jgi:hypothetical protein